MFSYRSIPWYSVGKMFVYRNILREQPRPFAVQESRRAPWLAVSVVCFGAFMGQLDASIVTITFPALERDFGVPVASVQWVSLIYLLGLVAMLAPAGRLGDAAGRKLVYTYGFAVFTVASAACALAPSLGVLVLLRLIQAAGAAMLQSNAWPGDRHDAGHLSDGAGSAPRFPGRG
jgi:predicted MFS family arabinose efflux permease